MELLGDQLPCGEIWQKSSSNKPPLNNSGKSTTNGEEGSKITSSEVAEIARTSSDISDKDMSTNFASKRDGFVYKRTRLRSNTILPDKDKLTNSASKWDGFVYKRKQLKRNNIMSDKDMFTNFASKWDGFVYKRRQLRRNTVTLLSEKNAIDHDEGCNGHNSSVVSTGNPLTVQKNVLPKVPVFTKCGSFRQSLDCGKSSISENYVQKSNVTTGLQIIGAKNSALLESKQNNRLFVVALPAEISGIHMSSSSSKSNTARHSPIIKTEVDCGECSSSDAIVKESLEAFTSAREYCISVLREHGLLVGMNTTHTCASSEVQGVNDDNISQPCKICGLPENPLKMLICDHCEDAFHVSCCQPKLKKLPVDYWYCQPCFRERPKGLLEKSSGKSANILSEHIYRESGGLISWMLRDNEPYKSDVRIGTAFQAEVPLWTGPISEDCNYFNEHLELDLAECASLNVRNSENPLQSTSFGNWIQCREVIHTHRKDKGTICGKWRRAPLFVVQTPKWDCSCAVLWDPVHADCAVPQLRSRLNITRQIPQESGTNYQEQVNICFLEELQRSPPHPFC
ncbi:uncharacterized protein LOC109840368 isoform X2 [Asparagus officinalis]|uniref:uncharacterized protein LOC109840368 isoform X2 n=1 Tax=Asparagus officinalis TaxID=4686 RepID=UPI00098E7278|nr:uncharacterized protein LOC109840368 isoform X2 [Asparagus officinalis]